MEISDGEIKEYINKLKNKENLFCIALDIGVSESSLYKFMTNYGNMKSSTLTKIRKGVFERMSSEPLIIGDVKEMEYKPYNRDTSPKKPEVLAEGYCMGYPFVIFSYYSHPCCYIQIPKKHILYGRDYDDCSINIHYGITYSAKKFPYETSFEGEGWVLGWDYAHAGDYYPRIIYYGSNYDENDYTKWTTEMLLTEVQEVAIQLKEMENIKVYL